MNTARSKCAGALLVGLSLVVASCGSDDDGSETVDDTVGETVTETVTETVQAAPSCAGDSDGVLTIAAVLPETGNLGMLGPSLFAGAELAVDEINEAGGVLGVDIILDSGDSGDAATNVAIQTVDRQLAAGADAFIGGSSSDVSLSYIDALVDNCKILFSPSNTSATFTTYPDDDLYFRTAPSDVLQGRVLADLMIEDDVATASFMALAGPYGDGWLSYSTEAFSNQGGDVVDQFTYDPQALEFSAAAARVVASDPEALAIIGFEETSTILASLFDAGFTPEAGKKIYLVDGNIGNALGQQLPAGSMEGIRGALPATELTADFRDRLLGIDPNLIDFTYGPETYDAIVIIALAAQLAGSDNPALIAAQINGVTRDGQVCSAFADCKALIDDGVDIDYDGVSGPHTFGPEGEPTESSFKIQTYDASNEVSAGVADQFRFAKL